MFSQCHYWPSNISGEQTNAQLWNPPDSGVDLKVSRIAIASGLGGGVTVIVSEEQAPDFHNKGHSRVIGTGSKCSAKGELRSATTTNWGDYQHYSIYVLYVPPSGSLLCPVDVVVPPGWGLMVVARGNHDLAVAFDWTEE